MADQIIRVEAELVAEIQDDGVEQVIEIGQVGPQGPAGGLYDILAGTGVIVTDGISGGIETRTVSIDETYLNALFVSLDGDTMTGDLAFQDAALQLDVNHIPAHSEGKVFYDDVDKCLSYYNEQEDMSVQVGQEQILRVVNKTGSTILNGKVVYINGAQGNRPTVQLADKDSPITADSTIGITTHDLDNNEQGYITVFGSVRDLDTNAFSEGDILYLGDDGNITNIAPVFPAHIIQVGHVTVAHSVKGAILCDIKTGTHLENLHDVNITDLADKDILIYDAAISGWKNSTIADAIDDRFVNIDGDTMTGILTVNANIIVGGGNNILPDANGNANIGTQDLAFCCGNFTDEVVLGSNLYGVVNGVIIYDNSIDFHNGSSGLTSTILQTNDGDLDFTAGRDFVFNSPVTFKQPIDLTTFAGSLGDPILLLNDYEAEYKCGFIRTSGPETYTFLNIVAENGTTTTIGGGIDTEAFRRFRILGDGSQYIGGGTATATKWFSRIDASTIGIGETYNVQVALDLDVLGQIEAGSVNVLNNLNVTGVTSLDDDLILEGGDVRFGATTGGTQNGNVRFGDSDNNPGLRIYKGGTYQGGLSSDLSQDKTVFNYTDIFAIQTIPSYKTRMYVDASNFRINSDSLKTPIGLYGDITAYDDLDVLGDTDITGTLSAGASTLGVTEIETRITIDRAGGSPNILFQRDNVNLASIYVTDSGIIKFYDSSNSTMMEIDNNDVAVTGNVDVSNQLNVSVTSGNIKNWVVSDIDAIQIGHRGAFTANESTGFTHMMSNIYRSSTGTWKYITNDSAGILRIKAQGGLNDLVYYEAPTGVADADMTLSAIFTASALGSSFNSDLSVGGDVDADAMFVSEKYNIDKTGNATDDIVASDSTNGNASWTIQRSSATGVTNIESFLFGVGANKLEINTLFGGEVEIGGSVTTLNGTYGGIHVHDNSTSQSIASGATYTKVTAFTDNDVSNDCTPDVANDKITITRTGHYKVDGDISFSSGTANTLWSGAVFLSGTEQNQVHFERKISTAGDVGAAPITGLINVTSVPVDLDFRLRHDNGSAVNVTVRYASISVDRQGEI